MANTYTQILIHAVFAVRHRLALINPSKQDALYAHITTIIQSHKHKVIAINGLPDHVHILFLMKPTQALADLIQQVKGSSAKWINTNIFLKTKFEWQEGYGAFSHEMKELPSIVDYIKNQDTLHLHKRFIDEYEDLLKSSEVCYNEKYVFKELTDQ